MDDDLSVIHGIAGCILAIAEDCDGAPVKKAPEGVARRSLDEQLLVCKR